jgi:hypothetical protein
MALLNNQRVYASKDLQTPPLISSYLMPRMQSSDLEKHLKHPGGVSVHPGGCLPLKLRGKGNSEESRFGGRCRGLQGILMEDLGGYTMHR